jgi:hypothetical protein
MSVAHLSNDALLDNAQSLLGSERELVAKLAATLAEVESRRLHLEAGYSSMFRQDQTRGRAAARRSIPEAGRALDPAQAAAAPRRQDDERRRRNAAIAN